MVALLPEFSDKILPRLLDETRDGPESLFDPVLRIVPFAASFLIAEQGLNRRVQVDVDRSVCDPAQLPNPFSKRRHDPEQRLPLIDA